MAIAGYLDKLDKLEAEYTGKFVVARDKLRNVTAANQAISATAVMTAAGGITTALTVVGLPATIVCSVISAASGITSISLNAYCKALHGRCTKAQERLVIIRDAKHKLQVMQGMASYENALSKADMKAAIDTYNEAIKKILAVNSQTIATHRPIVTPQQGHRESNQAE